MPSWRFAIVLALSPLPLQAQVERARPEQPSAATVAGGMLRVPLYFTDSTFARLQAARTDSLSPVEDTAVLRRLSDTGGGELAVFRLGTGYVTLARRDRYALVRVFDVQYAEIAAAEQVVEE